MEGYSVIVLIFGILLLFILVVLYFVNRILQYRFKINNSFFAVKEIIDERVHIIDDMLEFLERNLEHEKSYQKKLIQSKDLLLVVDNNQEGIKLIKKTEREILGFVRLEDTYKNLVRNKDYLKIKEVIFKNKERLVYAMDSYDKGVISYNNFRENKFIYLLSKLCGIPEYGCYNK